MKSFIKKVFVAILSLSFFASSISPAVASIIDPAQILDLLLSQNMIAPDKIATVNALKQVFKTQQIYIYNEVFTRDLTVGSVGADVVALKRVLNLDSGTALVSPEVSDDYFGTYTAQGVKKFQEKYASEILTPNNLVSGTGYVGMATRKKLNEIYFRIEVTDYQLGSSGSVSVSTTTNNAPDAIVDTVYYGVNGSGTYYSQSYYDQLNGLIDAASTGDYTATYSNLSYNYGTTTEGISVEVYPKTLSVPVISTATTTSGASTTTIPTNAVFNAGTDSDSGSNWYLAGGVVAGLGVYSLVNYSSGSSSSGTATSASSNSSYLNFGGKTTSVNTCKNNSANGYSYAKIAKYGEFMFKQEANKSISNNTSVLGWADKATTDCYLTKDSRGNLSNRKVVHKVIYYGVGK
jgi:hypothetical protein